ncbi:MAG: metallophosphoesterase [Alphaproteobacteria bacterium]|nr:metallophosphoesterase [Alphaproteobacteria bacterium]
MIMFFLMVGVIAICCSAITIKTLVGYGSFSVLTKALVTLIVTMSWFAPVVTTALKKAYTNVPLVISISHLLYFFFGMAFILLTILLVRDFVWYVGWFLKKLPSPKDVHLLNMSNVVALLLSFSLTLYSFYEGVRAPRLKEVELYSPKIIKEFRIILLTDTHINQGTTIKELENLVARVNSQNPDIVLLVGDIIDDRLPVLENKVDVLKGFKAKYGSYLSLGNHELYNGLNSWSVKFSHMGKGFQLLTNQGASLPMENVFLLGIPDTRIFRAYPQFTPDYEKLMQNASKMSYKILLSHAPDVAKELPEGMFDLQVSGHTHGGQIFPFHIPAKIENKFLAGLYNERGTRVYVSRGAGYWGPPIRFLAPSEITLIKILPEAK